MSATCYAWMIGSVVLVLTALGLAFRRTTYSIMHHDNRNHGYSAASRADIEWKKRANVMIPTALPLVGGVSTELISRLYAIAGSRNSCGSETGQRDTSRHKAA